MAGRADKAETKAAKSGKSEKQRLDALLVARGLAASGELARRLIMEGQITIGGQIADKPGMRVPSDAPIALRAAPRFVSRGGDKLDAALTAFAISVAGLVCADVGASTGGFTDCLLQRNAARVYAIDVGYGQLDYRLRQDSRVVVIERTNARYLESLPERVDLVVIDASFISLKLLLPVVRQWAGTQLQIVALIKPQFEAGREKVGKGGVIKDRAVHEQVLRDIFGAAHSFGLTAYGLIRSPLKGPAGNIEFLAEWRLGTQTTAASVSAFDLEAAIANGLGLSPDETASQTRGEDQ